MSLENNKIDLSQRLLGNYEHLKQINFWDNKLIQILTQYEKNLEIMEKEKEDWSRLVNSEFSWNIIPSYLLHTSNDWKTTEITGIYWEDFDILAGFLTQVLKQTLSNCELKDFKDWKWQVGFLSITLRKKILENFQTPIEKFQSLVVGILKPKS